VSDHDLLDAAIQGVVTLLSGLVVFQELLDLALKLGVSQGLLCVCLMLSE
jgi:hypothetical protein